MSSGFLGLIKSRLNQTTDFHSLLLLIQLAVLFQTTALSMKWNEV